MEYLPLDERLELSLSSNDMDLLQTGILNQAIHDILNHVAIALFEEANAEAERQGTTKVLEQIPQNLNRDDVLIRARIAGVRQGSIVYELAPVIAAVFSAPGAAAVCQNLISNVIWAVATYSAKVAGISVQHNGQSHARGVPATSGRKRIRPRVERLVKHLKEASNGGRVTIKTHDEEITIEFYPSNSDS
ncbi:hypothetical protein [Stenotrophomonas oahuensis]|uniref:Histidine kinase n=1 Tax=Stenotrophomonas oahuensis TaxID=3003271 RepID=A0ABY9YUG8_9GAMM|nr:hypothetical protein [Stenotrophomonas sp. A5586]WNH54497.1 hypothetical protein PDM29_09545 [Stenotrophomonas sp. A5586]